MPRGNQNFRQAHAGTPTPAGASGGGVKVIVESRWVLWLVYVCVCVCFFSLAESTGSCFRPSASFSEAVSLSSGLVRRKVGHRAVPGASPGSLGMST